MKLICYDPHARRPEIAAAMQAFPHIDFAAPTTLEALQDALAGAEILVTSNRAYEAEAARLICARGTSLRWLQFTTSGIDKAIALGLPSGVTVTNAAGLRAFSVAEHAFFLMLALMRQSRAADAGQRGEEWVRDSITPHMDNLAGKQLLIIGAGAIGQEIARKAKAFDMTVTGISRTTAPQPNFDRMRPRDDLQAAVANSDIVLMAANYEAETHQMMSAALFAAMKPKAHFINIARGALVDEDALVSALESGKIAGAGLDVTHVEPLPAGHRLYTLPNVVLTPHVAGAGSQGTGAGMGKILSDNLHLYLQGAPLQKIVIARTP
jgi:phosphoglycerate dehydrogenase-like enzyme